MVRSVTDSFKYPVDKLAAVGVSEPERWGTVIESEIPRADNLIQHREAVCRLLCPDALNEETKVHLLRWLSAVYHHRDQTRKQGQPYSTHLWETAGISLDYGFYELEILSACLAHDAIEDNNEVRSNNTSLFYTELMTDNPVVAQENANIRERVQDVTKPDIKDKAERSKVYLKVLIEGLLKGPHSILVKLFDRLHNMRTLDGHSNPEKQKRIAQETMDVFVPMARILGMYELEEELARLCLAYLNPDLLRSVDELTGRKTKQIEASDSWRNYVSIAHGIEGVRSVSLRPQKHISRLDQLPVGYDLSEVTIDDYGLTDYDSFLYVYVEIAPEADPEQVMNELHTRLPGHTKQTNKAYGSSKGFSLKIVDDAYEEFGGSVIFRVNRSSDELASRRGLMSNLTFDLPERIGNDAKIVLERVSQGEDIYDVVNDALLYPTINLSVRVNSHTIRAKFRNGITAAELYRQILGGEMENDYVYVQNNPFANPILSGASKHPANLPLPNGVTVVFG